MKQALSGELPEIEKTVDNRGIPCALGIFKVMQTMEKITPGRILEVLSTDRSSGRDLQKWTNRVGHQIIEIEVEGNALRPVWRITIRKKG